MQAYSKPMCAELIDGEVVLSAPSGAASVCLTPQAALETAERLKRAAELAQRAPDASQASQADSSEASISPRA